MEELITDNQRFFDLITVAIKNAKYTIDCEVYILANDEAGNRIYSELKSAAQRGVNIRLVVDGVGSSPWLTDQCSHDNTRNFAVRVYHPLPTINYQHPLLDKLQTAKKALLRLNRRNHKKLMIIDSHEAFSGSHNYWNNSLKWNEVGIYMHGNCDALKSSFEFSWRKASPLLDRRHPKYHHQLGQINYRNRREDSSAASHIGSHQYVNDSSNIQSNLTYRNRRKFLKALLRHIKTAPQRIWLITPYFVPPKPLLISLCNAAKAGKDVRVVLPLKNDHAFMRFAARYYYPKLIDCGVKIYEYEPQMLHAKLFLTDDWAAIGSTNLNHRSFFYDLELLITLHEKASRAQLGALFNEVFQSSRRIDQHTGFTQSFIEALVSKLIFTFRKWI